MPVLKAILVAKEVMIFREESFNGARERANSLNMLKGVFILILFVLVYS